MCYINRKLEPDIMKSIIQFFKTNNGYARMKDLKAASFHTRDIANLVEDGIIEKIKPGLYRLVNMLESNSIPDSYIDVMQAIPKGVICLLSALDYYHLTTYNPSEIYVAIPLSEKFPTIQYPPIRKYFFPERFYSTGINTVKFGKHIIRIYNREKTIADMFRYRKKLGEDLALEALKTYLKRKDANINRLREYADICQVKTIMLPYLKALVG